MIQDKYIEDLRSAADERIADIIGDYIKLEKSGPNFRACCPFHDEKTPSFHVYVSKPGFHCYGGCEGGESGSGDAIKFVELYEKVSFPEAVAIVARKIGFRPIEYVKNMDVDKKLAKEIESMKAATAAASELYIKALQNSPETVAYMRGRGIVAVDVQTFLLGYAPNTYSYLRDELSTRFSKEILQKASLIYIDDKKPDKISDRFANRVMFPIRNEKGEFVGFGGRTTKPIPEGSTLKKYINSSSSDIFDKGNILYGLYESSKAPKPKNDRTYFVVEGYMDVVATHRNGFTNTVAPLGTAFSESQARKLFLRGDTICFMQDADKAGIAAIAKGIKAAAPLLTPNKMCTVALLPEGEDPDSLLAKPDGRARLEQITENPMSMEDFLVNHVLGKNAATTEGKAKAIREIEDVINLIKDPALKLSMRQALFNKAGITVESASSVPEQKLSRSERIKKAGQSLSPAWSQKIQSASIDDLTVAGMLIKHKDWGKLLDADSAVQCEHISSVMRGLIRFASMKTNEQPDCEPIAQDLANYLLSFVPDTIDEQLEIANQFKARLRQAMEDAATSEIQPQARQQKITSLRMGPS